jgi:hypothetical protein
LDERVRDGPEGVLFFFPGVKMKKERKKKWIYFLEFDGLQLWLWPMMMEANNINWPFPLFQIIHKSPWVCVCVCVWALGRDLKKFETLLYPFYREKRTCVYSIWLT